MALVDSLLAAIVRADGDALVLHAGERPYVVAPSGRSELASRPLTLDAMQGMLNELLPQDALQTLTQDGAVQHLVTAPAKLGGEGFSVVAAAGGHDIWIEIKRHRKPQETAAPHDPIPEAKSAPAPEVVSAPGVVPVPEVVPQPEAVPAPEVAPEPVAEVVEPPMVAESAIEMETLEVEAAVEFVEPVAEPAAAQEPVTPVTQQAAEPVRELELAPEPEFDAMPEVVLEVEPTHIPAPADIPALDESAFEIVLEQPAAEPEATHEEEPAPAPVMAEPVRAAAPRRVTPAPPPPDPAEPAYEPHSAVVLPLSRNVRNDLAVRFTPLHSAGIDRLLRIAAARGASTLYLTSHSKPSIRVDGEISAIEGEPVLTEPEVEAMMLDIIPERNRETLRSQAGTEWICDVPDVGRIRCVTFRDHRGAGGIFRMIPARAISAEQLGLSREIQGLCAEADGLLLITGPRASGKSTLISAFVDVINRTRSDHVITLENQIKFVHENRLSLVSQREVRGDHAELMSAARAALRENPDVLVIEDLGSPEAVTLALEAAQSGHLVIGALTAHTTAEAVDRIIDQTPPERRPKIQLGLAEALRGVVGQVLLRKSGGGRVAAREVLLNTSAVANLIAEGKTSQLPMAVESGRKHGMVPLNDALASFVQSGVVDSREAYRQASDQPGFLALLKRQGIDTSFVERLA
ncbi:MAG TPA: ATPase, T2SS/T4P/T4SS family [Vicinamibacterales bacterium]|nr:ATPase, T2SS/T4P/T4SS family [Vicinamibacterales bacterium]